MKDYVHPYFEQLPVYREKPKVRTVYPDRKYNATEVVVNARKELKMPVHMCMVSEK